jgi:hypothetical protein
MPSNIRDTAMKKLLEFANAMEAETPDGYRSAS